MPHLYTGPVISAYRCSTSNEMTNGYDTMPINLKRSIVVKIAYCSIARDMLFLLLCGLAFPMVRHSHAGAVSTERAKPERKKSNITYQNPLRRFMVLAVICMKLVSGTSLTLLCGEETLVMPCVSFHCEETTSLTFGGRECFVPRIIC